jgi:hypothetical protein
MGEHNVAHGTLKLYVDEQVVAEGELRTMTGHFALCGEGLCIGYDGGDAVSSMYGPGFRFSGGEIVQVVFDVADDAYVDVESPGGRDRPRLRRARPPSLGHWDDGVGLEIPDDDGGRDRRPVLGVVDHVGAPGRHLAGRWPVVGPGGGGVVRGLDGPPAVAAVGEGRRPLAG